jgi:hypothetical protein
VGYTRGLLSSSAQAQGLNAPSKRWWYQRLLQYVSDFSAEGHGDRLLLYYKDMSIRLSKATLRELHRSFVTTIELSQHDLIDRVLGTLSVSERPQRWLTHNPLTAAFLHSGQEMDLSSPVGKQALKVYLDIRFACQLLGPTGTEVQNILTMTVENPEDPLPPIVEHKGRLLFQQLLAHYNRSFWQPCCSLSSWSTQQTEPGVIFYSLDQITNQTTGIMFNAGGYHEGPNH